MASPRNFGRVRELTLPEANEIKRLIEESPRKVLSPQLLVESAESPTSPFHAYFTWDDEEAAHKWRIKEAQDLIRTYTIYDERSESRVEAFTSLEFDRTLGGGYRWTLEAAQQVELRNEMVRTAYNALVAVRSKYKHLNELAKVWGAIEEAETTIVETSEEGKTPNPQA